MIKTIVMIVVFAIVIVLGYAATKPDMFAVERSITINAPPEKIYPLIDDFHNWGAWSPYEKMDPAMKRTLSGADSGRGAIYAWEGNANAGTGRMEITEAKPATKVTIQLDFTKPFAAHNTVDFTLEPSGAATHVTWAMHGANAYMAKVMGLFMNMDRMVGGQFESGLTALKSAAEK
jgi:carbon monoxide dehydrogenase subunit G